MSGFWAGAVPGWAWVVGGCLGVLLVILGVWAGYGRGFAHAEEEVRWAREQAKARRTHPVYRQPPEIAHERLRPLSMLQPVTFDDGLSAAITTGEIQAITDEMDTWLIEHVYSAPTDYGAWIEREENRRGSDR